MDFSTQTSAPEKIKTAALVVGVHADGVLTQAADAVDRAAQGAVRAAVKTDFKGKAGETLVLRSLPGVAAQRVVLAGLGSQEALSPKALAAAHRAALAAVAALGVTETVSALAAVPMQSADVRTRARLAAIAAGEVTYRFDATFGKRDAVSRPKLARLVLAVERSEAREAEAGLREGSAIANGMSLARDLGNLPGNVCTPTYLGETAKKLGKSHKLKVEVLDRKQIEALKMGSFLSVARGSDEPPKFIVLRYEGARQKPAGRGKAAAGGPVVLVGKGITFDAGGISLKPAAGMDEMKYDMCGAASVFGTLRAVAELGLPLDVIGVVPACENLPSGRANKPGDVVTTMSGQTVEILNTDAEGRLILCDALTYVERFKPSTVIDIATLTGACVTALGHVNTGLFTPDDALADTLTSLSRQALDPVWRLPLDDDYQEQLKSNFADMANIGGPPAGAVTAACFLSRYAKGYRWAHLDIAGTAWRSGKDKGATGRPVPLLTQYLLSLV
ncbi:leucyl aminopeptidase [Pigmentiphaga sp. GD03639]|uniref:leucyl aminopeptidase n=1 Tax=unclassified Pigmentiphaga TaxID=2626614 RepID=UPI000B41F177|nr:MULTISPECIES: leucyl aminopeptidase [unclassified Pigmentiphaga]MDH2236584.1 leucyl aminopeptidase [Pigmentiphaga sp. GD03639]OVZ61849.1 leucyl aminopeptidase [Pigmentiphaga sp. NML030171]